MGAEIGLFLEPRLWASKIISKLETGNWYLRHWIHEKNKLRASMTSVVTSIHNFKQDSLFRIKACRGVVFCEAGSSLAPLHLSRILYKSAPFMQNKPNLRKPKMSVSIYYTKVYKNETASGSEKTNPIQTQFTKRVKLVQSLFLQRIMKKIEAKRYQKTKPKQTQFTKRLKVMQSLYLQRIMKKYTDMGYEKTKPKQTQFKSEYRGQRSDVCLLSLVFSPLFPNV